MSFTVAVCMNARSQTHTHLCVWLPWHSSYFPISCFTVLNKRNLVGRIWKEDVTGFRKRMFKAGKLVRIFKSIEPGRRDG